MTYQPLNALKGYELAHGATYITVYSNPDPEVNNTVLDGLALAYGDQSVRGKLGLPDDTLGIYEFTMRDATALENLTKLIAYRNANHPTMRIFVGTADEDQLLMAALRTPGVDGIVAPNASEFQVRACAACDVAFIGGGQTVNELHQIRRWVLHHYTYNLNVAPSEIAAVVKLFPGGPAGGAGFIEDLCKTRVGKEPINIMVTGAAEVKDLKPIVKAGGVGAGMGSQVKDIASAGGSAEEIKASVLQALEVVRDIKAAQA